MDKTGNKLAFISNRRKNTTSAFVLSLEKPAAEIAPVGKSFDWEDIYLRVKQPVNMAVSESPYQATAARSPFAASPMAKAICGSRSDGSQVTRYSTGNTKPSQSSGLATSPASFTSATAPAASARRCSAPHPPAPATIPFLANMTISREELFAEMFEQSWRALYESFYDGKFRGADWNAVRDNIAHWSAM